MRTLILSIVCVLTLNNLVAQQNDLAYLDSNTIESKSIQTNNYDTRLAAPNINYLEKRTTVESSSIVSKWKHRLANYDLKSSSVFDDSEKATYRIVYNNKQVHIIAIYNNRNEILSTNETYRDIKIPNRLMVKISKAYPDYSIIKNTYYITYNYKTGVDKQYYRVQIGNGNKKRTLNFDNNFKAIQKT